MNFFERKGVKETALTMSAIGTIQGIQSFAEARVIPIESSREIIEFTYSHQEQEPTITVRFVPLSKFGRDVPDSSFHSPFVDAINKTNVTLYGANDTIEDGDTFDRYVARKIKESKKVLKIFGQQITPQDAIRMATYVSQQEFTYDRNMQWGTGSAEYEKKIDSMPVDKLPGHSVVCRHVATFFSNFLNRVVTLEKKTSPTLDGVIADEVSERDQLHVVSSIRRAFVKSGLQIYEFSTIDITNELGKNTFQIESHKEIKGAFSAVVPMMREYFFPHFSSEDQISTVIQLFDAQSDEYGKCAIVQLLYSMYREQILFLQKRNEDINDMFWQGLDEFVRFYEKQPSGNDTETKKYIRDVITDFFWNTTRYLKNSSDVLQLYKKYANKFSDGQQADLSSHAHSMLAHAADRYGMADLKRDSLETAYINAKKTNSWTRFAECGMIYADELGARGEIDGAKKVLEELYGAYQPIRGRGEFIVKDYSTEIYVDGDYKEISPFADKESFNVFLEYKLKHWK